MDATPTAQNRVLCRRPSTVDRFSFICLSLAMLVFMQAACTRLEMTPVSQNPTGRYNQGQIIWHDLITDDAETAKSFYGGLLGWRFEQIGGYTLVLNGSERIGGMVELRDEMKERRSAGWITYFSMPEVDDTANWVESIGGEILKGPGDMINRGRYATVLDPLGAPLVLLRAEKGDPPKTEVQVGDWLWNELWTTDVEAALDFYQDLGRYAAQKASSEDEEDYWILLDDEEHYLGGITVTPFDNLPSQWVPVVRVADILDIAKNVAALGGEVIINHDHPLSNGNVALIRDPTGGIFMVESWDSKNMAVEQK